MASPTALTDPPGPAVNELEDYGRELVKRLLRLMDTMRDPHNEELYVCICALAPFLFFVSV